MSADAVHSNIELKMKRQKNIYDFQDFKDTVMQSRKNIKVIEITCRHDWPQKERYDIMIPLKILIYTLLYKWSLSLDQEIFFIKQGT